MDKLEAHLNATTRARDSCYRLGDGELLIIAQETRESGAWLFAARVLQRLRDEQPQGADKPAAFSVGIAAYRPGDDPESLIARARRRADEAEAAGDNRVFAD